jgi:hypothetical protein
MAEIEDGRQVVETEVHAFTPEANPLVGYWLEVAQHPCDAGSEIIPDLPKEELVLAADGTFAVTWTPFESYVDYWGTYTFDLEEGTLDLAVTGGNDAPTDIDGRGRFAIDAAGQPVMTDIWLGKPRPPLRSLIEGTAHSAILPWPVPEPPTSSERRSRLTEAWVGALMAQGRIAPWNGRYIIGSPNLVGRGRR